MVEFALIGPLFFLFVVLVVQGALYINAQATIDNMTREVARAVAVCGTTTGSWRYQDQPNSYPTCTDAALAQRRVNFLPNQGTVDVFWCAGGNIPSSGRCTSTAGRQQPTTAGEQVEVDTTYVYTFWVDPLLGKGGPSANITSSARVVAQQ